MTDDFDSYLFSLIISFYNNDYIYRVSLKKGPSHIGSVDWIKGNKKFLYYFEIFAIVFELEKEMSKPLCD